MGERDNMPRVVVEHGAFLDATHCERCGEKLVTRTKSFFTGETIGPYCMVAEGELKVQIMNRGLTLQDFWRCGYLPDPSNEFKKPKKLLKKSKRKV